MLQRALNRVAEVSWVLLLVLLPLTSLPLISAAAGGSAQVAPPSGAALFLLVLIWLLPGLARRMTLPPQSKPLLMFVGAALLSSLAAYFLLFPLFRDINFTRQMLQAGLTLAVGVCMFLVVSAYPKDAGAMRRVLALIDWSGLLILLWSALQAVEWKATSTYPNWMVSIQSLLSSAPPHFYPDRVTGFAFEPSWLAHQLNMLYLPLWLAASVRRVSAHRLRLLGISFENLLLVGGLAVLWLSLSRVGLVSTLLMFGYLLIRANIWLVRWIRRRIEQRRRTPGVLPRSASRLFSLGLLLALLVFYVALILGVGVMTSRADPRMEKLFDFTALRQGNFLEYANQLVIAERVVYWQTGWEVFNDYPILGVGLGNAGYFFPQKMSPFGWGLVDVNHLIFSETALPNTKSMWTRLLSETGLVGFSIFLCWLLVMWASGGRARRSRWPEVQVFGLAGQLAVLAFLVEGFSIDSFAMPYLWVTLGLAAAAWRIGAQMQVQN
jgi:hypothetical protein